MGKIKSFNEHHNNEEVLLYFDNIDTPFVIKREGKYYIKSVYGGVEVEYVDDVNILLNAIKNVEVITYHDMFKKVATKEEYWQLYFNYMYGGKGDLVYWTNPTAAWKQELARRGELVCDNCGSKMIMYYKPVCYVCNKPEPDRKGRYMLIPVCYYVSLKNGLEKRTIWEAITKSDFIEGNDRSCDLYLTGDKRVDKYLKMIDVEFPLETTNFFVSW